MRACLTFAPLPSRGVRERRRETNAWRIKTSRDDRASRWATTRARTDDDASGKMTSSGDGGDTRDALASVLGESVDVAGEAEDEEDVGVTRAVTRETIEDASTPREMRVKMTATGRREDAAAARDDEEETAEEEEEDAMSSSRKMWREFLSLLVAVGGVKGTVAVCAAALCGGSAFGEFGDFVEGAGEATDPGAQALLGFALATPTMVYDAVVMGVDWTGRAEGMNEREGTENPSASPTEAYLEPMAKYQQEETLSNPCKSMPPWMDATVALTARVADEMLERGVVLGLTAKWLADRAVNAGVEPVDATTPCQLFAAACVYAALELRLHRAREQTRVQAFRVERNPVTGKQKLVPVRADEMSEGGDVAGTSGGPLARARAWFSKRQAEDVVESRTSPAVAAETRAFDNILRGKDVKDFLDGSRSRLFFVTQSVAFVAGGSILGPVVGGFAADLLYIAHQRTAMRRFIDRTLGEDAPAASAGPPNAKTIRAAQTAAFGQMIRRKKQRMGRDVIDAMQRDPSVSRDVNILFQEVVRKTKSVKNVDETSAVDEVLLSVSDYGAELDARGDGEDISYAEKMRGALERLSVALDDFEPPERERDDETDVADDR